MSISALWAKKSAEGPYWIPLWIHMTDTAEVAKKLWDKWTPDSVKRPIANSICSDEVQAKKLFTFLAAAHDIGKATPVFQAKRQYPPTDLDEDIFNGLLSCGLSAKKRREEYGGYSVTPHALATQLLLENSKELGLSDTGLCKNAAVILGAHHGKPPNTGYTDILHAYEENFGHDVNLCNEKWKQAQSELIKLTLEYVGYNNLADVPAPIVKGQVLLSGLIIVADWIASNNGNFPLLPFHWQTETDSAARAQMGWSKLNLPGSWEPYHFYQDESLFTARFGSAFQPNRMQMAAINAAYATQEPGIMIIEAPMGHGKTEAALVAAEVYRNLTESGGVFFALPTQATSDGIFPRMLGWLDKLDLCETQSVRLAHGKAQFNKGYADLQPFSSTADAYDSYGSDDDTDESEPAAAIAHQWFSGRKKALLANFVVGTIDQLLLMALKQKHVMLRHLGLAGKVVIIDECHAYDAYMSQYLKRALTWLGAYKSPVIILSATLPIDTRRELICAYHGKENIEGDWSNSQAYPLITYSDGGVVNSRAIDFDGECRSVSVEQLAFDAAADKLEDLLSDGGCAGVIMDTVQRAQEMASKLRDRFGNEAVILIHSRFIIPDRMELEERLRGYLGKNGERPEMLIVVGTQVLEQSLDIDFDVIITDIAPMDLLLQRIGRLHRHIRERKEKLRKPMCFVTGIDNDGYERGIDSVYNLHLLNMTKELLDNLCGKISLPDDIAPLVNAAYDKNAPQTLEKENWENKRRAQEQKADSFKMREPMSKPNKSIVNWLNTDVDDKHGEASVRDSYDSVDALVVKKTRDGFSLLNGKEMPTAGLDDELARELARQSVSLPRQLSNIKTIDALRDSTNEHVSSWLSSPWVSGELFLILDENNSANLCGRKVKYTQQDGLLTDHEN